MTTVAQDTDRRQIIDAIVVALSEVLRKELTDVTEETRLFDDLSLDSTSVLGLLTHGHRRHRTGRPFQGTCEQRQIRRSVAQLAHR
ncbi:hypothetical protein ABZ353_29865, partial [Streptomyces niveus]